MVRRSSKADDARRAGLPAHLTWWTQQPPVPIPVDPALDFQSVVYGWWAQSWQGHLITHVVVRRGTTAHAMRTAAPDADPATVLAQHVARPYYMGWSQGPGVMYRSASDALLAARLEAQSTYAAGLALVDQAYAAALARESKA